jgi:hypothetical protein
MASSTLRRGFKVEPASAWEQPMNSRKPASGQIVERNQVFGDISSLELNIKQDLYGYYRQHDWQRKHHFTKADIPVHLACANPRCQQGGLDLWHIVPFWQPGELSLSCQGHEGTPAGRRRGSPCDNRFEIVLSIVRT